MNTSTQPTAGAMRAAKLTVTRSHLSVEEFAHIIDRETGAAELVAALEAAMLELEANKVAMVGPQWASQRTLTGGALVVCARALAKAKGTTP